MYGTDSATIYDIQHLQRGKDYEGEAHTIIEAVRAVNPHASSLLDVACGTGGHFPAFTREFDDVYGVDISEPMLDVCRNRHPKVPVEVADMRNFSLERTFDVVTCLFASIGYVASSKEMDQSIATMVAHLNPGGVIAVEPQWFPERFLDGHISSETIEQDGTTIARTSHTHREGDASVMEVHYVLANAETGIRHVTETHRAMLFTRDRYEQAFTQAGLDVTYTQDVLTGRGLFLGSLPQDNLDSTADLSVLQSATHSL